MRTYETFSPGPSPLMLLSVARTLGHPRSTVGERTIDATPLAWRASVSWMETSEERLTTLRGLADHLLVATPSARERFAQWSRAAQSPPDDPIRRLAAYGEPNAFLPILEAIQRLPPAVREFTLSEVIFVATGTTFYAMTHSPEFDLPTGCIPTRRIDLFAGGPAEMLRRALLHEIGHAWCEPLQVPMPTILQAAEAAQAAPRLGIVAVTTHEIDVAELLADALAMVWDRPTDTHTTGHGEADRAR